METVILYNSLNIAEKIKIRSRSQGIAIKDMLVELELGSNTMSHMRHERTIASDSLARIADYLDCSVDYLLGRTDNPEINRFPKMKPIIDITFNRLTAPPPKEIQRIYDYVISLGWTEHQCVHRLNSPDLISAYSFMWLSDKDPVFPENVEYKLRD